ncbi:hypothetical protein [Parasphingopyxis sp.]|uniref:hypothetical protein n=1 Tax=Parasphingopyxis sp. TaxID=1920299 RepID=UPI00261C8F37|nr:hypothetical protein [Parasphingopyxis sp.]
MALLSTAMRYFLLLSALFMLGWGLLGLLEYAGFVLLDLKNPDFLPATQLVHFIIIFVSGAVYLTGYFTRWSGTPIAMAVIFGMLAMMCTIQTFDMMTNDGRYAAYGREIVMYIVFTIFLFRSNAMQEHFGRPSPARMAGDV